MNDALHYHMSKETSRNMTFSVSRQREAEIKEPVLSIPHQSTRSAVPPGGVS